MSWKNNYKKYIELLDNFINDEITAFDFNFIYSNLWIEDRDYSYENRSDELLELLNLLNNISYKISLLDFYNNPSHLLSNKEAIKLSNEILVINPNNKIAKKIIMNS